MSSGYAGSSRSGVSPICSEDQAGVSPICSGDQAGVSPMGPGDQTGTGTPESSARSKHLAELLRQAGLAGQVRLGAPLPRTPGAPASPGSRDDTTTNGAEEAFPPDDLLRPLARPAEGRLIEIAGAVSSGRTALAQRLSAGTTARGELVGWVDLSHALDPRSLQRAGTDLRSVLWVRPPAVPAALHATELLIKTGFGLVVLDLSDTAPRALAAAGPPAWSRLLRGVRRARSTVLVLSAQRVAGASSTLGLELELERARFDDGLLEGLDARLHVARRRDAPPGPGSAFALHHRPA